ncbi:actin cytoskeleton-regulatory complex protein pan1 isoform X3 [Trichoplusia ni]|uniref:Actin cytoskeleton-regulatory complex protein pan1 isoform X3 n=1 Tax=Trichoplusia ni TaxID=7111 RepID=A0A7E5VGB1_TRINI|nr:actin cytoskeleton-regulatory complex protein pan1 isoform X3 [Trichoplusia ni]
MVCKEDVVSWFKELESYKRIDAMCTLLNMCLPFELRFIGTYLEELGKRDFQELRGAELRANNPTDLAADIGGANTDPRTRRKMALYVSLLRSCNFACATTLYNAMVSLEQSGLLKGLYGDLLEEIFLLYTMALHHPAFTFDQKSHFGEILEKLKMEDQRIQFSEPQEHINLVPPQSTDTVPELSSPPVLTGAVPLLSEVPHAPPGLPLPQYNMAEYMGHNAWPANIIVSPINQPLEVINYTAASGAPTSPLVSSPGDSRCASPRARRRMSRERSPPPAAGGALDPQLPHQLAANFENLSVAEVGPSSHQRGPFAVFTTDLLRRKQSPALMLFSHEMRHNIGDDRLRELSAVHQQQYRSLEKLNGVRRLAGPYSGAARSSSDSGSSAASSPPDTPLPAPRRATASAPPPVPFLQYPRPFAYPTPPPAYRQPPPPFANGEPPPYPAAAPYAGFVSVLYAPPKLSCWNCGAAGHAGHECKEPSMEEMTRAGGYQLDFGGAPPEPADK